MKIHKIFWYEFGFVEKVLDKNLSGYNLEQLRKISRWLARKLRAKKPPKLTYLEMLKSIELQTKWVTE